jgi:hypothetical protein
MFVTASFIWVVFEGIPATLRLVHQNGQDIFFFALACAVFGWVFQAVAVICGVRLSGGAGPVEAADYDDEMPPPP